MSKSGYRATTRRPAYPWNYGFDARRDVQAPLGSIKRVSDLLADELHASGKAAVESVTSFPCHGAQPSGQRLAAAQAARSQDMADLVGKPAHLGVHQGGGRVHQVAQPRPPIGLV